jgi:hypothetical protein
MIANPMSMHPFRPMTFTWWQISGLKAAVFAVGLAVGSTWPNIFAPYAVLLLIAGLLLSIYLAVVWARKK